MARGLFIGGLGGIALAATMTGCPTDLFTCESDVQCGSSGQCEADGFCSFPDTECESGRRYGSASSAEKCVQVGSGETGTSVGSETTDTTGAMGTTAPTLSTSTTTTGAASSTSSSTSTSGPPTTDATLEGSATFDSSSSSSSTGPPPEDALVFELQCNEGQEVVDVSMYEHLVECDVCPGAIDGPTGSACGFSVVPPTLVWAEGSDAFASPSFTVMAWVSTSDPQEGCGPIATKSLEGGSFSWSLAVCPDGQANVMQVAATVCSDQGLCEQVEDAVSYEPGAWVHLAYTHDPERATLYLNGEAFFEGTAGEVGYDNGPLFVGGTDEQAGGETFAGLIGGLRVYNAALGEGEITSIYSEGQP